MRVIYYIHIFSFSVYITIGKLIYVFVICRLIFIFIHVSVMHTILCVFFFFFLQTLHNTAIYILGFPVNISDKKSHPFIFISSVGIDILAPFFLDFYYSCLISICLFLFAATRIKGAQPNTLQRRVSVRGLSCAVQYTPREIGGNRARRRGLHDT